MGEANFYYFTCLKYFVLKVVRLKTKKSHGSNQGRKEESRRWRGEESRKSRQAKGGGEGEEGPQDHQEGQTGKESRQDTRCRQGALGKEEDRQRPLWHSRQEGEDGCQIPSPQDVETEESAQVSQEKHAQQRSYGCLFHHQVSLDDRIFHEED